MRRSTLLLAVLSLLLSVGWTRGTAETAIPKIYVYGGLLFRSNPTVGHIDVFDLSSPATLPRITRILIPQNNDIAIVDDIMYADQGNDLVVFDISDLNNVRRLDTISSVFMQTVAWTRMPVDDGMMVDEGPGFSGCGCGSDNAVTAPMSEGRSDSYTTGQGGSMARFAVAQGHLYCIDESNLIVFDVSQPERPQLKNRQSLGWMIETVFPLGDKLFVGGARGLYIVDAVNPERPILMTEFRHGRACDPVVVEGNRAYVTLRGGTPCGPTEDQLLIIDITNLRSPQLLTTYRVENPYGLTVDGGIVYLCDGGAGLKVIDTRNLSNVTTVKTIPTLVPYDAIQRGSTLIVTAKDRVHIFDITDRMNPVPIGALAHDD